MIILIDKNFPVMIMKIDKFKKVEYKTFIKNMDYMNKKAISENCIFKLYIDLYYLVEYSTTCLTDLISYLKNTSYSNIDNVKIYINTNKIGYVMKTLAFLANTTYDKSNIEVVELSNPNKW